jgi:multidrug resistance protein, MATE family
MSSSEKPISPTRELLTLAWPLILSNSFSTIQVTIDRLFLSRYSPDSVSAAISSTMLFWTPFILFFCAANYTTTFVAQYTGAGRHKRVGAAVWQGIYFCILIGILFMAATPLAGWIVSITDHSLDLQKLETEYFVCLLWMGLPAMLTGAVSGYFSGRGRSQIVIWINLIGTIVHAILAYIMIFGKLGCPELGIAGAGWATVLASYASAFLGLGLMFRKKDREECGTISGWRFDSALFWRLMRFGLPSGMQWFFDMTAFTVFVLMAEWFSPAAMAATGYAITINNLAFLPMMGVAQAVSVLVGQKLGMDRPDLAEQRTWLGLKVSWCYMTSIALMYILVPSLFILPFQNDNATNWVEIAEMTRKLLWFVALYALFDSITLTMSFALRGAGDTFFVSMVSLVLAWPVMVVPTYASYFFGWGMYPPWAFAALYIALQASIFIWRFRGGKWKSMRVIEAAPVVPELATV